jgi:AraC-like DNA-binding protein
MQVLFLDTILRGGAAGIFAIIAIILISKQKSDALMWLAGAFFVCVIGHTIDNSAGWRALTSNRHDIFQILSVSAIPLLWAFLMGVFDDRRDQFWPRLVPFGVMGLINLSAITASSLLTDSGYPSLWFIHIAFNISLMAHILWVLARGISGDLVDARRRLRAPTLVAAGLYVVGMAWADIFGGFRNAVPTWPLLQSTALFALAVGAACAFLQSGSIFWGRETKTESAPASGSPVENALAARLQLALVKDKIWQREGLTIGTLAAEFSVPEYRLRRVINERLAHRNFADFINSHRIEAAMLALAQPVLSQSSISQLAFELGFASLGPFNRAFKRVAGVSPTAWRHEKLTQISKS